ncbi:RNA-directed DNA polymerase [uncultured Jatrophihabitans sp.]|uniref:RNA-directed DNA polymerase n=1 Tax=uncultured Jatrophihabitans sp. TaxID=1610747 RepID=UPI0035CA1AC6
MPMALLDALDLIGASSAEAATHRNLIPPEPWLDVVANNASAVAGWVRTRLEAGSANSVAPISSARKPSQGNRPVAIAGIAERIAYRALAAYVLDGQPPANRTAEAYRDCVVGPIAHALADVGPIWTMSQVAISHVVESDITAFYQYVDHELLHDELVLQTGRVEAADFLCDLLVEIQGAKYGLPQLLDASDELSEVYLRVMDRDVIRRGHELWRYNDDFRITVTSYERAQDAMEQLAEAARRIGLVLSDHKSYITRFRNYLVRYVDVDVDADAVALDPQDVEAAVVDYAHLDDDDSLEVAISTLARLDAAPNDVVRLDLKNLTAEDLRFLRRAIGTLTRLKRPEGLKRVNHLFLFAPALTPRLVEYLIALYPLEPVDVRTIWTALTSNNGSSFSEWQATWLLYAARQLGLLNNPAAVSWAQHQRGRVPGGLLAAESSFALAQVNSIAFADLDNALRSEPDALAPWYVLGVKALAAAGVVTAAKLQAVKDSSPIFKILLES